MKYKVISYCPDRHIEYDGETPYKIGVGGGITARVRMAKALAALGHEVTMVVNCPQERWIDGVQYLPLDDFESFKGDVAILNTSGGDLDLSPALGLEIESRLTIIWVHGESQPSGLAEIQPDYIYAVSDYIAGVISSRWEIPDARIFVSFNGYDADLFDEIVIESVERDPNKLAYCSHPSKGLDAALQVTRLLREKDLRYHLDIYGGSALWGGKDEPSTSEDGVYLHGLVDQPTLIRKLHEASFSLHLQNRQEPFGMSALEAMRAGCIVLASNVGAFPEFIDDGRNGYIVDGDAGDLATHTIAAEMIRRLSEDPRLIIEVRQRAETVPWSSSRIAALWERHWKSFLD